MASIAPWFLVAFAAVFACLVALGLVVRSRQGRPAPTPVPGPVPAPAGATAGGGGKSRQRLLVGAVLAAVLVLVFAGLGVLQLRDHLASRSHSLYTVGVGSGFVRDLVVSPRGGEFAVANDRGSVQIRGTDDGAVRLRLEIPSNDEMHLAYSGDGALLAAGVDEGVYVWDVTTGQVRARIPRLDADVLAVALSPDGKQAVILDDKHVWRVELAKPNSFRQLRAGIFQPPGFLVFGPDSSWAAGWQQYANGPVTLFNLDDGDDVRRVGQSVSRASFSPDKRTVLVYQGSSARELARYDTTTGEQIGPAIAHTASGSPPIALSPDGTQIAGAEDSTGIHLWNAADGRELGKPRKLSDPPGAVVVTALAYTTDGNTLLVAYYDRVEAIPAP